MLGYLRHYSPHCSFQANGVDQLAGMICSVAQTICSECESSAVPAGMARDPGTTHPDSLDEENRTDVH